MAEYLEETAPDFLRGPSARAAARFLARQRRWWATPRYRYPAIGLGLTVLGIAEELRALAHGEGEGSPRPPDEGVPMPDPCQEYKGL